MDLAAAASELNTDDVAPRAELQIAPGAAVCIRACVNVAIILMGIRVAQRKRRSEGLDLGMKVAELCASSKYI